MIKAENVLQKRLEYFKRREYEKIYETYSSTSEFRKHFESAEQYGRHFTNLIKILEPESIEIYKVLYDNTGAEVLFLEKLRDLQENKLINCYVKSYFVLEDGCWKIIKETRESELNKRI